ncbi:hypothetical protein [uncultured Mobiluncus sp.]|mgnify:CR=1 FL=1|uniref:hypothetical protein n=1 Tax=uncultured Mobiluncus sp. TaxID=293425 RepID=UPI0026195464|nr:hypothetical protein [uncultured Mobiluncus sp.]
MIAQARLDLKELLETSKVRVYPYPPERIEAPCIVIDTAPRLEEAETFGALSLSFKLTLLVAYAADFGIQVANLDRLLDTTLDALGNLEINTQGHLIISQPDSQQLLAYELTVTSEYERKKTNDLQILTSD